MADAIQTGTAYGDPERSGKEVAQGLQIWQETRLMEALLQSGIFPDQKTIVDMPLKVPLREVMRAFEALPAGTRGAIDRGGRNN